LIQYNKLLEYLTKEDRNKYKEYHQLEKVNLEGLVKENCDSMYCEVLERILSKDSKVATTKNVELLS
jgi:hypothetical protein